MEGLNACHYCDAPAPLGAGGEFVYLVQDESGRALEPSCAGHATHGADGKLIDWRLRGSPAKNDRRVSSI